MCFNLFSQPLQSGALEDERPVKEKEKDYRFEEIVAAADAVTWVEKDTYRRFPIFDQNGSYSCVAQTLAKVLGVMHQVNEGEWIKFSPGFIYQLRFNRPNGGMAGIDAWEIVRKNGALLDEFFRSDKKTEAQLDGYQVKNYEKDVASIFKIKNYVVLPTQDIDTIASVIQKTNKAVMVWFYFTISEWKRSVPVILNHSLSRFASTTARHSVTAVDYTLYKGKKALIIDDSWGLNTGINGQRIITEDFFKERNFFAAYPINFVFGEETTPKPKYEFNNNLQYGLLENPEVVKLQDVLKWFGYFPLNVTSTGNYYSITAKAVLDWQIKYNVDTLEELERLRGHYFGVKSRTKMNELLS